MAGVNTTISLRIKRVLDFVFAFFGIIIVSPILLCCSFLVLILMGRPVFFKQLRPGYKEKPFYLYKFRTMRITKDGHSDLPSDAERLTFFGNVLRKTSLDELPELFNVLKGEMSLIGPRPLLMEYLDKYSPEQRRRHKMLPGITGWAQVNGRNAISWKEKFKYDSWYIDNWSLWLDLKIFIRTIWMVIRSKGISQTGHATMEKFKGDNK